LRPHIQGEYESLDKKQDRQWVDGDFNKLKIYTDCPGNYDAWDILPNYKDKQIEINVSEEHYKKIQPLQAYAFRSNLLYFQPLCHGFL